MLLLLLLRDLSSEMLSYLLGWVQSGHGTRRITSYLLNKHQLVLLLLLGQLLVVSAVL